MARAVPVAAVAGEDAHLRADAMLSDTAATAPTPHCPGDGRSGAPELGTSRAVAAKEPGWRARSAASGRSLGQCSTFTSSRLKPPGPPSPPRFTECAAPELPPPCVSSGAADNRLCFPDPPATRWPEWRVAWQHPPPTAHTGSRMALISSRGSILHRRPRFESRGNSGAIIPHPALVRSVGQPLSFHRILAMPCDSAAPMISLNHANA